VRGPREAIDAAHSYPTWSQMFISSNFVSNRVSYKTKLEKGKLGVAVCGRDSKQLGA
jgi:hypothetical protein